MQGVGFDYSHLIWIISGILLNIAVFIVLWKLGKYFVKEEEQEKFSSYMAKLRAVNIAIWLIIIAVTLFLGGTKKYIPPYDMGAETTQREIREYEQPTLDMVENINVDSLVEKEILIRKEVKREQKESSEDYEKFLNKALKNNEKE